MASVIPYLVVILLVVSIIAVLRLWSVLGSVKVTLANLETTRLEATQTLKRLDATVATADTLLRDEVTPTLQVARATLINVEETTRTLAEASVSLRRITGKAEATTDASRLIMAGTALAMEAVRRKQGGMAKRSAAKGSSTKKSGGLLALVGAQVIKLLTRGRKLGDNLRSDRAPTTAESPQSLPAPPAKRPGDNGKTGASRNAPAANGPVNRGEELRK